MRGSDKALTESRKTQRPREPRIACERVGVGLGDGEVAVYNILAQTRTGGKGGDRWLKSFGHTEGTGGDKRRPFDIRKEREKTF